MRNPFDRLTARLPHRLQVAVDWVVTIVAAVAIVLAVKAWVVNPYRIPSASMEPTLHCARPENDCQAGGGLLHGSDRVLANRFIYHFMDPDRGDIVVFQTPDAAQRRCLAGGTYVKRIVGLPGETIRERDGTMFVDGKPLDESYVPDLERDERSYGPRKIPSGQYFVMGDNRAASCDSRDWGTLPRDAIIGKVFATYWPPARIGFR
jgi:signal peptidase I